MRMRQEWNPDFHCRLSAVLALREISRADLAKACGVSQGFVSLMCKGKKTPGRPVELLLSAHLGPDHWRYVVAQSDVLSPFPCMEG